MKIPITFNSLIRTKEARAVNGKRFLESNVSSIPGTNLGKVRLPSTALDPKRKVFEYTKFIKNRKNVHLISMNDMVKLLKDYHDTE